MVNEVTIIGWILFAFAIVFTIFKLLVEFDKVGLKCKCQHKLCTILSGAAAYLISLIVLMFFLIYINDESTKQKQLGDQALCQMAEFADMVYHGSDAWIGTNKLTEDM